MAFHGTFEHSLDAKNRLTVPSKLRAAFSEGAFLVEGADRCISLYPAATYSALTDAALSGLNPLSAQARELKRFFHSNAHAVELDSAGRVMLGSRRPGARGHRSGRRRHRRRRLLGALGPLHLGGLRPGPHGARA